MYVLLFTIPYETAQAVATSNQIPRLIEHAKTLNKENKTSYDIEVDIDGREEHIAYGDQDITDLYTIYQVKHL